MREEALKMLTKQATTKDTRKEEGQEGQVPSPRHVSWMAVVQ